MMLDRLHRLMERLHGYPWWQVAAEVGLIWVVVFVVFRFVQGTRAAGALKGTLFIIIMATLVVRIIGQQEAFQRIKFLYDTFLTLLAITLIVVFQPELRRGLIRLGETPLRRRSQKGTGEVLEALVEAAAYLSKASFGGLIVVEREHRLKGLVEGGTAIQGQVSARLLQTIFFPGSALHDLAVIVRGGEVVAAGVQLPLADPEDMPDPSLGSRHRAAVGLTKECDALVIVVSEETGAISIAERGRLERGLSVDELRDALRRKLRKVLPRAVEEAAAAGNSMSGDSVAGMNALNNDSVAGAPAVGAESRPVEVLRGTSPSPAKAATARRPAKRGA
jgi:diadenylate cyclase